ncbi:MAG: GerMN domain-containing protein [Parcubacteria group bacterium]
MPTTLNKNKWIWISLAAVVVIGVIAILFYFSGSKKLSPANTKDLGNAQEKADLIKVNTLVPNETITLFPVVVKGEARGSWFFEASFPVEITDGAGVRISSGIAKAESDWMTSDFVPFSVTLDLSDNYQGPAKIIFHKDNPSDIRELDDSLIIPVNIDFQNEQMTLNVYFSKTSPTSDADPCNLVYPAVRKVPETQGVAKAAILELLKGPTETERTNGFLTSLPDGVALNRISITDGVVYADFSESLEFQVGGSCRVTAIRSQITETLKQFPAVKSVVISINGRSEDILQP